LAWCRKTDRAIAAMSLISWWRPSMPLARSSAQVTRITLGTLRSPVVALVLSPSTEVRTLAISLQGGPKNVSHFFDNLILFRMMKKN